MRPFEAGDIVRVVYNNGHIFEHAKIVHVPVDVGDSWIFDTQEAGLVAQNPVSSNFDKIILVEKGGENKTNKT